MWKEPGRCRDSDGPGEDDHWVIYMYEGEDGIIQHSGRRSGYGRYSGYGYDEWRDVDEGG